MAAQGSYSLACSTVAASGKVAVAVQHAGDHIVACDMRQNRDRVDQLSRCLCAALTATTVPSTTLALTESLGQAGILPQVTGPAANPAKEPSISVTVLYS
jgi:hypothetical protein